MATKVERAGIEACITRVNTAIETLNQAAAGVNSAMNELPAYWEGAAYNRARATYEEEYQPLLTTTLPEAVSSFRDYIRGCMETILEIDSELAAR